MVAVFSLDISVFLSLPCTFEVYLCCWSFLDGGLKQDEAHFIDICKIRGWWPSWTNTLGYLFALLPITGPFPTLSFPSNVLSLENGAQVFAPTIAPKNSNFSLSSEEKNYNFDVSVITIKSIRVFKPRHVEWSFLPFHESFWRLGTRTSSLNALDRVTLQTSNQTSNGGTLIQRFRFYLQYLGGIASPSFFVSTIKASRRYSFHFSSEFAISERSYLCIHHTFTKETSKILQRQEDQFASYST